METLQGAHIKQLGFVAHKAGDLLYHDGPLLSHYNDSTTSNAHYLYKWSDCDEETNRWMVIKVSQQSLVDFLNKKVSLKQIIDLQPFVYFVDIADQDLVKDITVVGLDDIPEGYLPYTDSFYDETGYERYAEALRTKLRIQTFRFRNEGPAAKNIRTLKQSPFYRNEMGQLNAPSQIPNSDFYLHMYPQAPFRNDNWYMRLSSGNQFQFFTFGDKIHIVVDVKNDSILQQLISYLTQQLKEDSLY